jgi:hypothetical protein
MRSRGENEQFIRRRRLLGWSVGWSLSRGCEGIVADRCLGSDK